MNSLSKKGRICASSSTPAAMMTVVTMEEVAMATVEISSPSSLPASTPALCMALSAQGTLRLERLPVTKPR